MNEVKKYLTGKQELSLWTYEPCTDDWRQYVKDGERVRVQLPKTLTTKESMRLYKDAGFNLLFVNYVFQEDVESPEYDFEKSRVKYAMDLAHEVGLKCVVFVENVHKLSRAPWGDYETHDPSWVGEGKRFQSMDELVEFVKYCYRGIIDHPAYYGTCLFDEPQNHQMARVGQVYEAIRLAFGEDHYVLFNLLPYYYCAPKWRRQLSFHNYDKLSSVDCYKEYMEEYYARIGKYCGYIRYDAYPLIGERYDDEGNLVHGQFEVDTFLFAKQMITEYAQEHGMKVAHVVQTCKYEDRRAPSNEDIRWMTTMGIGMGEKDMSYYTYYPPVNSGGLPWDDKASIVTIDGEPNPKYYEIKDINAELKHLFTPLSHFEYSQLRVYKVGETETMYEPSEEGELKQGEFTEISSVDADFGKGGVALVVEHTDKENGKKGYFVMNMTSPREMRGGSVTLTFKGYTHAQVWKDKKTEYKALENGKLTLEFGVGRGAFILPYNE